MKNKFPLHSLNDEGFISNDWSLEEMLDEEHEYDSSHLSSIDHNMFLDRHIELKI